MSDEFQLENKDPLYGIRGLAGITAAGLIFILLSGIVFSVVTWRSLSMYAPSEANLSYFAPIFVLCGVGVFCAVLGVSLLRAGGLTSTQPNRVINEKEWEILSGQVQEGNEDAVTQYIRLTSLSGLTGLFTKLGLSGLPLATIALTIFFSIMFFQNGAFMDLAKLTLGAFIGSFVQKQAGGSGPGSVKLPSGEKLSFSSNSELP